MFRNDEDIREVAKRAGMDVEKAEKSMNKAGLCIMGYSKSEDARYNCQNICGSNKCYFDN